tara:strand:- start:406 stop:1092 length:687 start_codon:yes stop_codon:yes gene_type:complete
MSKIIIANFKMNGTRPFINKWFSKFLEETNTLNKVIVALPTPYLTSFSDCNISIAAQNVSPFDSGSFTSQVSAEMLKDCGIDYCIIGHSESRNLLNETNEDIFNKYNQLSKNSIKPIICVGESMNVREDNQTSSFITDQLNFLSSKDEDVIIAYEPIWAIGSGLIPAVSDINEVCELIKSLVTNAKILYGGSVNEKNATHLLNNSNIDGLLVGGASLDPKEFANIAQL